MMSPRPMALLALTAAAAALGCGEPARDPAQTAARLHGGAGGCPPAGLPAKLVLHEAGVPDQFVVAFAPGTDDVPGRAAFLTLKHGGRLLAVNPASQGSFEIQLQPDRADELAGEPDVCLVEQDAGARAN